MKIKNIINEGGIADIPPRLLDRQVELYREYRIAKKNNQLEPIIADDILELFQHLDDDIETGDAGMARAGLDEIEMLLRK